MKSQLRWNKGHACGPSWLEFQGSRSLKQVVSYHRQRSREAKRNECRLSPLLQSRIPARECRHPQWTDLSSSINVTKIISNRHAQMFISGGFQILSSWQSTLTITLHIITNKADVVVRDTATKMSHFTLVSVNPKKNITLQNLYTSNDKTSK